MERRYSRLFALYSVAQSLFQETVRRIDKNKFDSGYLYDLLASKDPVVLEATRRILLTHFPERLSRGMLYEFRDLSGDEVVQKMTREILEKRRVEEDNLRSEADCVVELFA